MREIVDQLIEERAPWMRRRGPLVTVARPILHALLQYDRTVKVGEAMEPLPGGAVLQSLYDMLCQHVEVTGLENVPRQGPAMVIANHPTGIADGIVLYGALSKVRPDLFIFANADALRVLPQLEEVIAPVEWRPERRTHRQNRETMDYARRAFEAGRMAVLFPSGRLAKRRWWSLHERPWMASGAMMARRFNLPVVPLHITARNSALFYLFDRIHPTLRDITLFHEVLNKTPPEVSPEPRDGDRAGDAAGELGGGDRGSAGADAGAGRAEAADGADGAGVRRAETGAADGLSARL